MSAPGSLLHLVFQQDENQPLLTESPQVTFFQSVTQRYTPFAIESICHEAYNGRHYRRGEIGYGQSVTYTVPLIGDLVSNACAEVRLPTLTPSMFPGIRPGETFGYVPYAGAKLHKSIKVSVANQKIDWIYSEFLVIWGEISTPQSQIHAWRERMGADGNGNLNQPHPSLMTTYQNESSSTKEHMMEISFPFWFCQNRTQNYHNAFPMIAMLFNDIKIWIEFCEFEDIVYTSDANVTTLNVSPSDIDFSSTYNLWFDYVFLSQPEREYVASKHHKITIHQLQSQTFTFDDERTTMNCELNFSHPVMEFLFFYQPKRQTNDPTTSKLTQTSQWLRFDDVDGSDILQYATLKFNNIVRQSRRHAMYYSHVQMSQHHTRVPSDIGLKIYNYSFALAPENTKQLSGACNMSAPSLTTTLHLETKPFTGRLYIYARNCGIIIG